MLELFLEVVLIITYMHKFAAISIIVWIIIMLDQYYKRKSTVDYWIKLIILSLPISYLEINCEVGAHIFKWYNFSILCFGITMLNLIIRKGMKIEKKSFIILTAIILFQLCRNLFTTDWKGILSELVQEYIVVITVWLFFNYKRFQDKDLSAREQLMVQSSEWTDKYQLVTFASAICILYQFLLYTLFGQVVGFITFFPARTVYDMTFTGYSVLSALLGGGLIISLTKILNGERIARNALYMVIIFMGCGFNTSRSGLYAAIIIMLIMIALSLNKKKGFMIATVILIPVLLLMIFSINIMLSNRNSLTGQTLLSDNGRFALMKQGLETIFSDINALLFGLGINAQYYIKGVTIQHNMFLEMLELNGLILFIPFVVVVLMFLRYTKEKENRYLLWHILLSHQFYSSFFATTFLLVVLILSISSRPKNYLKKSG